MLVKDGLYVLPTDQAAIAQGCFVDTSLYEKFSNFCESVCCLTSDDYSGSGQRPLKLLDWQQVLCRTLLSWKRPDGTLRFRKVFVYIPKRSGKTVLMAALSMFMALQQSRSQVCILAATIKQAGQAYDRIRDFVTKSPKLSKAFKTRDNLKTIEERTPDKSVGRKLSVYSSEADGISGQALTMVLWDEFAEAPRHSARTVYARLEDSGADRPNSFAVYITTPQFDFSHIAREKYLDCKRILEGNSDDVFTLPVIYEAPDNWQDDLKAALRTACPSLNQTVPEQYYLDRWAAVKDKPLDIVTFETLCLGRWVGSPVQWIKPSFWDNCKNAEPESKHYGKAAIIGIDYGRRFDLTAYTVIVQDGDLFYFYPRFFIPADCAQQKQETDNFPYLQLAPQHLTLTPGNVVDTKVLRDHIRQDCQAFNIQAILFDPTGMEACRQELEADGYKTIEVTQSRNNLSGSYTRLQELIVSGKARHPDHPVLNWCLQNCIPSIKEDKLYIDSASDSQKIDGIQSIATGLKWWLGERDTMPEPPSGQRWAAVW